MIGNAVETMVWSSAASSIPSMITPKTRLMWRRSSVGRSGSPGRASAVLTEVVIRPLPRAL